MQRERPLQSRYAGLVLSLAVFGLLASLFGVSMNTLSRTDGRAG